MNVATMSTEFTDQGLVLEMDVDRMVSKCVRPSKRARMGYVLVFHFRFRTVERMFEHAEKFITLRKESLVAKTVRNKEKKARVEIARKSVKVGDIFVSSWGYDQTNVDAFQVVAKKGKASVVLREIALASVGDDTGPMSDKVVPVRDSFIEDESGMFTKIIGEYGIKLNSCSSAYWWDGEREFHRSWYA